MKIKKQELKKDTGNIPKIKNSLLADLKKRDIKNSFNMGLVDDYVHLLELKEKLQEDIDKRGVSVYYCNGGGQEGYKRNDSVAELNKVQATMLKILTSLGIKNDKVAGVKIDPL